MKWAHVCWWVTAAGYDFKVFISIDRTLFYMLEFCHVRLCTRRRHKSGCRSLVGYGFVGRHWFFSWQDRDLRHEESHSNNDAQFQKFQMIIDAIYVWLIIWHGFVHQQTVVTFFKCRMFLCLVFVFVLVSVVTTVTIIKPGSMSISWLNTRWSKYFLKAEADFWSISTKSLKKKKSFCLFP